jgi:hypothetical protein
MGIWVEADNHVPAPGDIIMYDWQDSGSGDNRGGSDHVGIVEKVSGNTITVIEGNYSNAVKRRTLQVNGRYIRGYCVPDFASKAEKTFLATPKNIKTNVDPAKGFSKSFAKTYVVTASNGLNMRKGAATDTKIIKALKKGEHFICYGYYTQTGGTIWLLGIDKNGTAGFCSKKYLK